MYRNAGMVYGVVVVDGGASRVGYRSVMRVYNDLVNSWSSDNANERYADVSYTVIANSSDLCVANMDSRSLRNVARSVDCLAGVHSFGMVNVFGYENKSRSVIWGKAVVSTKYLDDMGKRGFKPTS